MIHISDVAIDYIWEKFEESLIEKESRQIAVQVKKVVRAASHKPLHENSAEYHRFLLQMEQETIRLESKYVHLNLSVEKEYFKTEKEKIERKTR
jgi:hypothetical protein